MKNQDTLVMTMISEHLRTGCHISELNDNYIIRGVMPEDKIKRNIECIRDSAKMMYDLCNVYLYNYNVNVSETAESKEDIPEKSYDRTGDDLEEINAFLKFADALNSSEDRYI